MPEIALKVLDDAIEFCVAKFCKDKAYPDNIENIILSRLYTYAVKESNNYSWNVFVSEVHDPNQGHLNDLHSSHELLITHGLNTKDNGGVTKLHQSDVHLRFYTKSICLFKVNG